MILATALPSDYQTRTVKDGDIELMASCDDLSTYSECGWFCILGYKNGRRAIHVHLHGSKDFFRLIWVSGYVYTGCQLVEDKEGARENLHKLAETSPSFWKRVLS